MSKGSCIAAGSIKDAALRMARLDCEDDRGIIASNKHQDFRGGNKMRKQPEETEREPKKRRKKKKKFGYYLYAIVMLVLIIANITIATFLLTYVQKIKVTGTKYSTDSQIVSLVKKDPLTVNSIYAVLKYKLVPEELPAYLENMKVGWDMPWGLHIKVEEKQVIGGILTSDAYIYFSEDGTILAKGEEALDGVIVVEGVDTKKTALYEKIELEDEKIISYVVRISEELKKLELTPDRIVWEEDSMNLYFKEICVQLGKLNFDEKLVQVPPILQELEGKKGILHLEHYNEMSTSISFEEN